MLLFGAGESARDSEIGCVVVAQFGSRFDPTESAIDYACRAALYFGAKLSVTSPHLSVRTPRHVIAGGMMAGMARGIERDATAKSAELEHYVRETATGMGIDVTIVPIAERWPSSAKRYEVA